MTDKPNLTPETPTRAERELSRLCREGTWRMSIPARSDYDSDLIIGEALAQLADALRRVEAGRPCHGEGEQGMSDPVREAEYQLELDLADVRSENLDDLRFYQKTANRLRDAFIRVLAGWRANREDSQAQVEALESVGAVLVETGWTPLDENYAGTIRAMSERVEKLRSALLLARREYLRAGRETETERAYAIEEGMDNYIMKLLDIDGAALRRTEGDAT